MARRARPAPREPAAEGADGTGATGAGRAISAGRARSATYERRGGGGWRGGARDKGELRRGATPPPKERTGRERPARRATPAAGHARDLARSAAGSGEPLIVSVSGDGGYNEVVNGVMDGSAAARAGLRVGDVIRAVNGRQVNDSSDLPPLIGALPPKSRAELTIVREIIPRLKALGAEGIIEYPLNRLVH